jgi:hypothetical protein
MSLRKPNKERKSCRPDSKRSSARNSSYMRLLEKDLIQIELNPPKSFSRSQARVLSHEIENMPFAGLVALLAGTSFRPGLKLGEEWLGQAAQEASNDLNVNDGQADASEIKDLLVKVFRQRVKPSDALTDKNLSQDLMRAAVARLATQTIGFSVDSREIQEVVDILETGKFFGDFSSILWAIFHTIPGFPADIVADLEDKELSNLPASILGAVLSDTTGFPAEINKSLKGNDNAQVLSNTLGALKKVAVTKRLFILLRSVLSKDNRSARIALILYARANAVAVSESNIDNVYSALDPDNPSIGFRLREALEIVVREYGADAGIQVLKRLRSI